MKILLVVLDKESHINSFPLGVAYLASSAKASGFHDITIWNQDVYHYPDSAIKPFIEEHSFDFVGIGICGYQQYKKALSICHYIHQTKNRPFLALGAHGPSGAPEFFLKKTQADAVIRGEGENIFCELLRTLKEKKSLKNVKGLTYRENEKFFTTPDAPLIPKLETLPFPAWELFPMDHYVLDKVNAAKHTDRCFPVLASRGCPQHCNFCYRMYEGQRLRSASDVIKEIKELKERFGISYITFVDENLMSSEKRALDFSKQIKEAKIDIRWDCMGRLNVAKPHVLEAMKEAGCTYINYGIESLDSQVLKNMNKDLSVEEIYEGIENTIRAGLYPGLNILWGNIGDNEESLKKNQDFLIRYNTPLQIRTIKPVTPYPGTELFKIALEKKLLRDEEDFYERYQNTDRMTVNFTDLSDERFYQLLFEANKKITLSYYEKSAERAVEGFKKCYFDNDLSFRGPRHT